MSRSLTVAVAALALVLASTSVAHAQEPNEQLDEAARLTFHSAREAFVAGEYERALGLFRQAYNLSQRPGLLYNIAQTLDRLRRDAETLQALRDYLEAFPAAPNQTEVQARIRVLEEQVSRQQAQQQQLEQQEQQQAQQEQQQQQTDTPDGGGIGVLHPAVFIAVGGLALVGGGLALWAGLETLSLNDTYTGSMDRATIAQAYDDAESMQVLANIFIFSSAGLGVAAVVLAILTDWGALDGGSESAANVRPAVAFTPWGASAGLQGSF